MAAHLSPVNGLLQQAHHVLSLAARRLETFCPLQENSLLWKKPPVSPPQYQAGGTARYQPGVLPGGWGYLIQVVLLAGEGERESERERYALHSHVLQEVGDAVDNVVEELDEQSQREKLPPQPEPSWKPACPNCWGFQPIPRPVGTFKSLPGL